MSKDICYNKDNDFFINYIINYPIKMVYKRFDPKFCDGKMPPDNIFKGKTRDEVLFSTQQKMMDYIFLIISIIYFLVMHFYFKTIFVRTPEQRAAYDKDTKEKSYSFIRLIQVMLKNFEQYSIPTALIIYMLAFITFMHYKISFLTPSVNKSKEKDNVPRTTTKELFDNLQGHFQNAKNTAFKDSIDTKGPVVKETLGEFLKLFIYIVLMVYVSATLLLYIVKFVIRLQSFTGLFLFFTNILTLLLFIGISFKVAYNKIDFIPKYFSQSQLKLLFRILKSTIFYIPCLVTDIIASLTNTSKDTKKLVYVVLLVEIGLVLLNTIVPVIDRLMSKHLGSVILRKPVYLNTDHHYGNDKYQFGSLVLNTKKELRYKTQKEDYGLYNQGKPSQDLTYKELNILGHLDILGIFGSGDDVVDYKIPSNEERSKYDHNYAMSFWYYINPMNENTSRTYNEDALMINFANRPRIEYNHSENKVKIIMRSGPFDNNDKQFSKTIIELKNIPLQKWNHLVINYTSGTLDIFMDGILVESRENIKPLMQEGAIITGQEDGINGRISNVAYYNKPLNKVLIDFLYNSNKNYDTPIGGGFMTNMYFLLNTETTVIESLRRPFADILAEILPKKISFSRLYNYIINLPDTLTTNFWYVIDRFLFDYYEEIDTSYLITENKSKTGFELDLEYRQNS